MVCLKSPGGSYWKGNICAGREFHILIVMSLKPIDISRTSTDRHYITCQVLYIYVCKLNVFYMYVSSLNQFVCVLNDIVRMIRHFFNIFFSVFYIRLSINTHIHTHISTNDWMTVVSNEYIFMKRHTAIYGTILCKIFI